MFRWGVLSTAKIGRDHVLPAIQDSENGVLTAVASRDGDRARQLADRFGAQHSFDSYEAMLDSDVIDGVYIPTVTSHHVEWSARAAAAGKHVLCEKPIALRAEEIGALIAARDHYQVLICEAFMVTHHPQWHKVRELIQNGAIGTLRHVQGAFSYYLDDATNMRNDPDLGGGGLLDIGVYPTVTTRFVTQQEPSRIRADIDYDPNFGTDRFANVTADFGGFQLSFYCSTQMAERQLMVFHGDKGFIEVKAPFNAGDYEFSDVALFNQDHQHTEIFRFSGARHYKLQAEAFVRAARGDKDSAIMGLEDSVLNQKVIDAAFRAGETRTWENV